MNARHAVETVSAAQHAGEPVSALAITMPFDIQRFADPPTDPPKDPPKDPKPKDDDPKPIDPAYETRLRNEARKEREQREAAEKERDDLKKWREERERKDLETEKKFEDLAKKEREGREADNKAAAEKLAARESAIIRARAEAALEKLGVLDPDAASLFGLDKLKLDDNGNVIDLKEWADAAKAAKPSLFKSDDPEPPDHKDKPKPSVPPKPKTGKDPEFDADKLSPEAWRALRAKRI